MTSSGNSWKIPWHLIIIFCLLSLGISLTGYFYYDYQQGHLKRQKQDELAAIVKLKILQIHDWRQERLADAMVIMEDPFFTGRVKDWLAGRTAPALKEEIRDRLESLKIYQYQSIVLIDPQGTVRLSVSKEMAPLSPQTEKLAREVMRTKKVILSDLYRNGDAIRLSLFVPLLLPQGGEKILAGVILLQIDPHQFLYPLIQSWPTPSPTGEIVLVRKEGDRVVFLNDLRHRKNAALTLGFPLSTPKLPAAMAARGETRIFEGIDYRGLPVIGAIARIPDSPWFLVAKVDRGEAYANFREHLQLAMLLIIVLIAGAGISVAYIFRNQQATFFRQQYEVERSLTRQLLTVQEEERSRLSRELHDGLGQTLLVLKLQMRALQRGMRPDQEALRQECELAQRQIKGVIEDVRHLSRILSPSILEDLGLTVALRHLVEEFQKLNDGLTFSLDLDDISGIFPKGAEINIYRVFQESLSNICKYAQARRVSLAVKREGGKVTFAVEDDGRGFQVEEVRGREAVIRGLGMATMAERVRMLRGELQISSKLGAGTRISFTIPEGPQI
jgi:signal transduction histidine kinase